MHELLGKLAHNYDNWIINIKEEWHQKWAMSKLCTRSNQPLWDVGVVVPQDKANLNDHKGLWKESSARYKVYLA